MKVIPGYSGYYASDDGLIYSTRSGEILLLAQRKHKGYLHVTVKRDDTSNKPWKEPVHKLVLLAFSGVRKDGQLCRHLNGNPFDNRYVNLKWGTAKENTEDAIRHGTASCLRVGEQSAVVKLTTKDIICIKELIQQGKNQSEIARQFNISQRHVSDIKHNRTWKHLLVG